MSFSPLLAFHISAGIVGILSGAAAMSFRKGSPRHALAGKVFVISMLTMAATAVYLAVTKHQSGNVLGGAFTFYLVATAWLTAGARTAKPASSIGLRFYFLWRPALSSGFLVYEGCVSR